MLGRQMSTQRRPTGGSSRINESSDTPDNPDKPQDYPGLRAELAELVNDFLPVADELWPRLQDHKYRWELSVIGRSCGGTRPGSGSMSAAMNPRSTTCGRWRSGCAVDGYRGCPPARLPHRRTC